jgi:hypothetical protein
MRNVLSVISDDIMHVIADSERMGEWTLASAVRSDGGWFVE